MARPDIWIVGSDWQLRPNPVKKSYSPMVLTVFRCSGGVALDADVPLPTPSNVGEEATQASDWPLTSKTARIISTTQDYARSELLYPAIRQIDSESAKPRNWQQDTHSNLTRNSHSDENFLMRLRHQKAETL